MTPDEEERIRGANRMVPEGTVLRLVITADGRSAELSRFCEQLTRLLPQISVVQESGPDAGYPHILLPGRARYQGVPKKNELDPFLDELAGRIPPLADDLRVRLATMELPAALDLYVTPQCRHCPQVVRRLVSLAQANRFIQLTIVDAALFPEPANLQRIRSVPTVVLDAQFRWTGGIGMDELVAVLSTRDPASLGPDSLEMMLKEGLARRIAEMMAERNTVFPALLELLCHLTWPVRLGAMVAMEELGVLRPGLARQALDPLWERFENVIDQVKGDFIYLVGELGDEAQLPKLDAVRRSDAAADVKEAVDEAVAKLRIRSNTKAPAERPGP
jgi:Thioredoxin domain